MIILLYTWAKIYTYLFIALAMCIHEFEAVVLLGLLRVLYSKGSELLFVRMGEWVCIYVWDIEPCNLMAKVYLYKVLLSCYGVMNFCKIL
jgi:hypothetical protein